MTTRIDGGAPSVPFSGFQFEVYTIPNDAGYEFIPQNMVGFTSVSGLNIDTDAVEYKEGNSLYTDMLPGMTKPVEVTLERGLDKSGYLLKWKNSITEGSYIGQRKFRADLIIVQYDRAGTQTSNPDRATIVQAWRLREAWPKSYSQDDLGSNSEITLERVTMCCYGPPEAVFGAVPSSVGAPQLP